jgi:hypothetical protein
MTNHESSPAKIMVQRHDQGLLLTGGGVDQYKGEWGIHQLLGQRLLLEPPSDAKQQEGVRSLASLPMGIFTNFLYSLQDGGWSGVINVDTGYGTKRLFFSKGEIVFAGSNLIDDRLGEILFRESRISLDELTQSAAQVTKTRKFGQVLVASGVMTQVGLWNALSQQVIEILRSIFLVERVFFDIQVGNSFATTEVTLPSSTKELIRDGASYGTTFRGFVSRLTPETQVHLVGTVEELHSKFPQGTFWGDIIALVSQFSNVQQLIDQSKLMDLYTASTLFQLSCHGLIQLVPELDDIHSRGPAFHKIRSRLDAYSYVLGAVSKAFSEANKEFPIAVIQEFVSSKLFQALNTTIIEKNGEVSRETVFGMIAQVEVDPSRFRVIDHQIESLIQFLIQVAGDSLHFSLASKIREEYRSISN